MGLKTFVFQEAPSNRLRLGGEFHVTIGYQNPKNLPFP